MLKHILAAALLMAAGNQCVFAHEGEDAAYAAAAAMVHSDPERATALLSQFIAAHPASPLRWQAQMDLADCLYGQPRCRQEALDLYSAIDPTTLPEPKAALLAYRKAYCQLELGRLRQACKGMAALSSNATYGASARFYMAYALYAQGDYAAALPAMERARSATPPGNSANFYLAQMYYDKGDYARALGCASLLLKGGEGVGEEFRLEAMRIAGECSFRLGRISEARRLLSDYAASCHSPLPSALYVLGLMAYEDGDYARAVQLLTPASEGGDAMAQSASLYIGQARLALADFDAAIMAFDKALNMDFDPEVQEAAFYNYAVAAMQGGKVPFGNPVAIFESFVRKYPGSERAPQAQQYIINDYFKRKDYAAALASIDAMSAPSPATEEARLRALYMLGAQQVEAGRYAEAIKHLSRSALAPHNADIAAQSNLLLGEAYYAEARFAESVEALRRYLSMAPRRDSNRPLALFDLGYSYLALADFDKAADSFQRYIKESGAHGALLSDAYTRLGDCDYARRRFDSAEAAYLRALDLNPAGGDYALLQLALMQGYQRNYGEEIRYMERLIDSYPSSPLMPRALISLAQSRLQQSDTDGAVAAYKRLLSAYPASVQARQGMLQMALALANSGRRSEAKDAYKGVVTAYPASDEAAQAIEALKRMSAADGSVAELRAFLSAHSAADFDNAEADDLTFEAAEQQFLDSGDASALLRYIGEYPNGAMRPQALTYLTEMAQGQEDEGRTNLALSTWRQLAECGDYATEALAHLGIARCGVQAADYSIAAASAAIAKDAASLSEGDRVQAAYLYGICLDKLGKAEEAAEVWSSAATDPALYYGMAAAVARARASLDSGKLDEAEALARAAAEADTPHAYWVARAFIVLSDVYKAKGDEYKAAQYIKSLRDNYPGDEPDIIADINSRLQK